MELPGRYWMPLRLVWGEATTPLRGKQSPDHLSSMVPDVCALDEPGEVLRLKASLINEQVDQAGDEPRGGGGGPGLCRAVRLDRQAKGCVHVILCVEDIGATKGVVFFPLIHRVTFLSS